MPYWSSQLTVRRESDELPDTEGSFCEFSFVLSSWDLVMCGVRVCCVFVCPFVEKVVSFRIEVTTPYCANHLPRPLFLTTRENVEGYYGSFSSLILIKKRIPLSPQINILLVNIRRLEGNTISETHKSHIHNQSNLVHVTKQCRTHSGFSQYTIKTIALKR